MSFFGKIEEACAAFVERAFAATFPGRIEPALIARKLVATMEANTVVETTGRIAPNEYVVRVHPDDYARLEGFAEYLQDQWAELLAEIAERVSVSFPWRPSVRLIPEASVVAGAVEIVPSVSRQPARAATRRVLRVSRGVSAQSSYELTGSLTVGRDEENDVVLADPRVSRRHARLTHSGATVTIEDCGSSNGTFVNGVPVGRAVLAPGDVIVLGETELTVD